MPWALALLLVVLPGFVAAQSGVHPSALTYVETAAPARSVALAPDLPWPQSARLLGTTTRYAHDVLGGTPRWTDLRISTSACADCGNRSHTIRLPETLVFEDTGPRFWDVTGDGSPEIVVVESHLEKGARLVVWSFTRDGLKRLATTPHIGRSNRWLAPFGVADFNGDGKPDIAYVDRPHLAKELVIVTLQGAQLSEVARAGGVTNHRIGEAVISGGVRDCGQGPEAILANANWTKVVAVQLIGKTLQTRTLGPYQNATSLQHALSCP
jgi:hypothetical protein